MAKVIGTSPISVGLYYAPYIPLQTVTINISIEKLEMKVTRLDKRHKGTEYYQYYVTPVGSSTHNQVKQFHDWRVWCWESWGAGAERDYAFVAPDAVWGWHSEYTERRIYLKSVKELNWFKLRWS